MPLEVKDVEWSESEQYVTLRVPLKGASSNNVDIFSTSTYIKVSYPPYFFEVALYREIDDDASKATVTKTQVTFHLQKCKKELWGQLNASECKDKTVMKKIREEAVEYKQKREKEKAEKISKERDQQKKFAVREQIRLDTEERKQIEHRKQEIEVEHVQKMEAWKKENSCNETSEHQKEVMPSVQERAKETSFSDEDAIEHKNELKRNTTEEKVLPEPRSSGNIQVNFTARQLPTPARESKLPEEEVWLKKLAEMNKMKKTDEDATDIEEMNPIWLKDKGDDFFKKGNHVAAINAYTSALLLDSKIPMLYANRAACHLSLKQYNETVQDCTCALELYDPPVQANVLSRCRALIRRGTAHFYLNNYVKALTDYDAAIKLDPKNESLKADAYKIRRVIQGEESSDY